MLRIEMDPVRDRETVIHDGEKGSVVDIRIPLALIFEAGGFPTQIQRQSNPALPCRI